MEKVGRRSWKFWSIVENDRKKYEFFKKRFLTAAVLSQQLECSTFDKLLKTNRKYKKKVCSILGICKNNVFFLEQSTQFSSGQLKRSFDNPTETCWRKSKSFQREAGETMEEGTFSWKISWHFFRRWSRMQFWPDCWENLAKSLRNSLSLSQFVHFFNYIFWPMIQLIT